MVSICALTVVGAVAIHFEAADTPKQPKRTVFGCCYF
jgi:hypothetical protein